MSECSAYITDKADIFGRNPHCKNGFFANDRICRGMDSNTPPQCMSEKACAHFYPETGSPISEFLHRGVIKKASVY